MLGQAGGSKPARSGVLALIGRWLRRSVIAAAYAYPIALIVLVLSFLYVGESWWPISVGLYVPRYLFLAPIPVLALALLLCGSAALLRTQLAAALIVLVFLMGFVLPWPAAARGAGPTLRVLSFNADSGRAGYEKIVDRIRSYEPDVVLIQEAMFGDDALAAILKRHYPHVHGSTQFAVASRFPIAAVAEPEQLPYHGRLRSPRFVRYRIDTSIGRIAFYNAHPLSPRGMMNVYRLRALPHEVRTGQLFAGDMQTDVQGNAALRALQVATMSELAAAEQDPVVIAGDLNLPDLSAAFRRHLSRYQDGFRAASWGFGYTYTSKYMPLRLDRVLAGPELKFVGFQIGCQGLSDHLCVVADLQRR